jgi:hypothetical protein
MVATEKRCRITTAGVAVDANSDSISFAVQIAKSFGCHLDAIASERN